MEARARAGRILRSADFERVLAVPPRARTAHFVAHHLPGQPSRPATSAANAEFSTGTGAGAVQPVDESPGCWVGWVVPKRHARRAVTRTMMKRQMRSLLQSGWIGLAAGLWVLRLRAPFDVRRFVSADSAALREATRTELDVLLQQARRR